MTTELLDLGIIEPVEGSTPWVNPVVIVPKNNWEICLCVNTRQANQANYPTPTVDKVLHTMNSSKVFSKLVLKCRYHQLELSPESREITSNTCSIMVVTLVFFIISGTFTIATYNVDCFLNFLKFQPHVQWNVKGLSHHVHSCRSWAEGQVGQHTLRLYTT